jgi:serpin B
VKRRILICNARLIARAVCAALAIFSVSIAAQEPNRAAAATNAFAVDLYGRLANNSRNNGQNLWFSPYSITSALAMTAEGARGSTLTEMAQTLRFSDPSQPVQLLPIHEDMAELNRLFNTSGAPGSAPTTSEAGYELVIANALWGEQQYPFDPSYVDTIHKYYDVSGIFPATRAGRSLRFSRALRQPFEIVNGGAKPYELAGLHCCSPCRGTT